MLLGAAAAHPGLLLALGHPHQRRLRGSRVLPATAQGLLHHATGSSTSGADRSVRGRRLAAALLLVLVSASRSPGGRRSTAPEACRWWRPSPPSCTGGARGGPRRWRCTCWARRRPPRSFGARSALLGGLLEAPWGRAGPRRPRRVAARLRARRAAARDRDRAPASTAGARLVARVLLVAARRHALRRRASASGSSPSSRTARSSSVAVAALASGTRWSARSSSAPFGLARGLSAARSAAVRTQQDSQRLVDRLAGAPERRRVRSRTASCSSLRRGARRRPRRSRSTDGWASFATAGARAGLRVGRRLEGGRRRRRGAARSTRTGCRAAWTPSATFAVPAAEAIVPLLAAAGADPGRGRVGARAAGRVHGRGAARVASLRPPGAVRMLRRARAAIARRRPARAQRRRSRRSRSSWRCVRRPRPCSSGPDGLRPTSSCRWCWPSRGSPWQAAPRGRRSDGWARARHA